jgi:ketosteroid isomerase-like protein
VIAGSPRRAGLPAAGELAEDVTAVRAVYRALEESDLQTAARHMDPRVEWVDPAVARLPFDGVLRGLPSVMRAAFRRNEDGDGGPRIFADTFLEMGDGVLVVGRFAGAEDADAPEVPFLHECSVRTGRVIRIREYPAET